MPMLDDIRKAAARQRSARATRRLVLDCKRLLSGDGEMGGMAQARSVIGHLEDLADEAPEALDGLFDFLASDLSPDPATVLRCAQDYAARPDADTLKALTAIAEPRRQELFRRLNRQPGGTAAVLGLRRALLKRLRQRPELQVIEADLLHLLSSWFNPGFLQMRRVDWNSPAQLLEKIIRHEAVHAIDGWDDLRRRLQPDRRCFAFFHPQLPAEPLIFVEVALLPELPAAIAPLIDKSSTPAPTDQARAAAFYSISNCESGLRGVSLGNFLIKTVAQHLQRELPRLRTFGTLSPIPGFAHWLLAEPDLAALPGAPRKSAVAELEAARARLRKLCGGDLDALRGPAIHAAMSPDDAAALQALCGAYLLCVSPTPAGDPVARFHLDNGARLERLNLHGNMSPPGLRQSFGMMVNYLYDLDKVEAHHARFRQGEVVRSRGIGNPL
jgi:malonyl-CoA decarboxylase